MKMIDKSTFNSVISKGELNIQHLKILQRYVFEHWKIYIIYKLRRRKAVQKADNFYRKKILLRSLHALLRNVSLKVKNIIQPVLINGITKQISDIDAEIYANKILLNRYFKQWYRFIEVSNQEIENIYRKKYLKKFMQKWKISIARRKRKNILHMKIDKARRFYERKLLQKGLQKWLIICEPLKLKEQTAITYYEKKLLRESFSEWTIYQDKKVKKREILKKVQNYTEKKILNQYFVRFYMYVIEMKKRREAFEKISKFYQNMLIEKVFLFWKEWYYYKRRCIQIIEEFNEGRGYRIKSTVFFFWKLYIYHNKCKRRKLFQSLNFFEKKLLSKAFKKLRHYVEYKKDKKKKLSFMNSKSALIIQQIQCIYIEKWRESLYDIIQEKRKLNESKEFWEFKLIRKYFNYWIDFLQMHKIKMCRKRELTNISSKLLLKKYLLIWQMQYQIISQIHEKENRIILMMEMKVKKKYFINWKKYNEKKLRKKDALEAAKKLHNEFLLREGLKNIVRSTLQHVDYCSNLQLKNICMKSIQNFELLRQFFYAWQSRIYFKKCRNIFDEVNQKCLKKINMKLTGNDDIAENIKHTGLVYPEYMQNNNAIHFYTWEKHRYQM